MLYEFYCENCGTGAEVTAPMSKPPGFSVKCKICSELAGRIFGSIGSGNKEYGTPIVSHSLGIHPEQIPEHNKLFPDIKVREDGCPLFYNYQQHDKYLKKIGWEKQPKRGKKVKSGG